MDPGAVSERETGDHLKGSCMRHLKEAKEEPSEDVVVETPIAWHNGSGLVKDKIGAYFLLMYAFACV